MSLMTLGVAKQWLQISHTAEDAVLQIFLDGIEEEVASLTATAFGSSEYTEDFEWGQYLWPSFHPITAIDSVTYRDSSTALTAYAWKEGNQPTNHIWRTGGDAWYDGTNPLPWRVVYTAGYANLAAVPSGLQMVVLDMLKQAYDSRGGVANVSAAGVSKAWSKSARDDIRVRLRPFSFNNLMD